MNSKLYFLICHVERYVRGSLPTHMRQGGEADRHKLLADVVALREDLIEQERTHARLSASGAPSGTDDSSQGQAD
jgi:hypothetical protein